MFLFTFHNVQYQARVLKRMEVYHVAKRAICQCWTEHWNVVLKQKNSTFTDLISQKGTVDKNTLYMQT